MSTYIQTILNSKRLNYNTIRIQNTCSLEPCSLPPTGCCFINGRIVECETQEQCENAIAGSGVSRCLDYYVAIQSTDDQYSCPSGGSLVWMEDPAGPTIHCRERYEPTDGPNGPCPNGGRIVLSEGPDGAIIFLCETDRIVADCGDCYPNENCDITTETYLCEKTRIAADCGNCYPNEICAPENEDPKTGFWVENCENCIYVKYEHPIWTTGNVQYTYTDCSKSSYNGAGGCDTIVGQIFIPKPLSLLTSAVRVDMTGFFDDSISIDGVVVGSCKTAGYMLTSTTLSPSQSGFMLGAVDSYGVCCHGDLAICFSEII